MKKPATKSQKAPAAKISSARNGNKSQVKSKGAKELRINPKQDKGPPGKATTPKPINLQSKKIVKKPTGGHQ